MSDKVTQATPGTELLTVGELRKRLESLPDDAIVMLACDDPYYDGPVSRSTTVVSAERRGPFEYQTPTEDDHGRKVPSWTRVHPGGWRMKDNDTEATSVEDGPVVERRVAFVLSNGG